MPDSTPQPSREVRPGDRYLISIASYKRPADLQRLLDSIAASIDPLRTDIVVVDNDPDGTAESTVADHPLAITYALEPTPGIASARNRGLERFTTDHAAIIFIDDDEWVSPDWFRTLTSYAHESGSDVVSGPVLTILPGEAPSWVRGGGFYQRSLAKTGTSLLSTATNNTLLRRDAWIRAGSPSFDVAFSTTGGSDWDFFWAIRKSGATIRYCADAIVWEDVPASRLSFRWLRRRAIRNGIVNTRVKLKHGDPLVMPLLRGIVRAGYNGILLVVELVRGRGIQSKPLNAILHEYGKFAGLFGYRIHEYKRE